MMSPIESSGGEPGGAACIARSSWFCCSIASQVAGEAWMPSQSSRNYCEFITSARLERQCQRQITILWVAHIFEVSRCLLEGVLADHECAISQVRLQKLEDGQVETERTV